MTEFKKEMFIKAVEEVIERCRAIDSCEECPAWLGDIKECGLGQGAPYYWDWED